MDTVGVGAGHPAGTRYAVLAEYTIPLGTDHDTGVKQATCSLMATLWQVTPSEPDLVTAFLGAAAERMIAAREAENTPPLPRNNPA